MYNVLVVDDDVNVRKGLNVLVPWEEYGFKIVETAADGKEALEKYKKNAFDLIIVDMQMPRMSGIDFIASVRKMDPFVHFLVLSGHAEFDYARKSIDWKVDGYVLKPIDESELEDYLSKIEIMLDKEREEKLFTVGENLWRCEVLIQSIISGSELWENTAAIEKKALQIGLSWPSYQVLLIEIEDTNGKGPVNQVNVRRSLKQAFNSNTRGIVFRHGALNGILLNNSITRKEALECLYDELVTTLGSSESEFYAAVGEPVQKITSIGSSYETASRLLKNRFIADKRTVLNIYDMPYLNVEVEQAGEEDIFDIQAAANKLYYAIDIGNKESVNHLINECETAMIGMHCSEKTIKSNFIRIISAALNKLPVSSSVSRQKLQDAHLKLMDIYNQPDFSSLQSFITRELDSVMECFEYGSNEVLVKKILDFVDRNYEDKLTLEILAETFNYTSGYLGRLFKKHTGESFNTYLDGVRIEKAKKLLLQGIKVYQVAEMTGYSNVDYFHSKFRKYAGVSPAQFKKLKM